MLGQIPEPNFGHYLQVPPHDLLVQLNHPPFHCNCSFLSQGLRKQHALLSAGAEAAFISSCLLIRAMSCLVHLSSFWAEDRAWTNVVGSLWLLPSATWLG